MKKNRRLPPLNALKAFEATARHQSITKAAEELCVTQAAVSQQVKLLEAHLERQLLHRNGRHIRLTDEGRQYLPVLNTAFDALAAQTHELFGRGNTTVLRLRCTYSFAQCWLTPRLGDFVRQYPTIRLRVIPSNTPVPETDHNEPDLEILNGYGNWLNKQVEQITEDEWVVVASNTLLTHYPMPAPLGQFAQYPKIASIGYRESWQDWFSLAAETGDSTGRKTNVTQSEADAVDHTHAVEFDGQLTPPQLEAFSTSLAIQMAESGAGFLLVKRILVQSSLDAGRLRIVHPVTMPSRGHHYLLTKSSNPDQVAIKLFKQWLYRKLTTHDKARNDALA